MVDSRIYKTTDEQNATTDELSFGIGIDDIPKNIRDEKIGKSTGFNLGKVNVKPLDDRMRTFLKPKKKDDPFDKSNWKMGMDF